MTKPKKGNKKLRTKAKHQRRKNQVIRWSGKKR